MPDYDRAIGSRPGIICGDRTCLIRPGLLWRASIALFCLFTATPGFGQNLPTTADVEIATVTVIQAQEIVSRATLEAVRWSGPESGPQVLRGKSIAFVAEDLRNGGIVGVAQGAREAAKAMGWTLKIFDGAGSSTGRAKAFSDALAAKPDGLILCGSDALENKAALALFAKRDVPVVAWHAGARPGPIDGTPVAMNVTTDPLEVARLTAMAAVAQSNGRAGVVILTDSKYSIAMAKAKAMENVIRGCRECTLLEVRDVAISESGEKMPVITKELLQRFGKRWTHTLAINDIYFDYSIASLTNAAIPSDGISLLSAGDGSASAFLRIQAKTYQTVTVAEPLNLHGWQVMDELNRLFAGQPVSGFVAPIHLVNADNIAFDGGKKFQYDPDNGYRDIYRHQWNP
ncbi:ribose transport system substrate-binding protein [Pseudomonas frederiksbergensis]|uniref:Ribose transport system substrate-binding protein n=1 Tax=Pseudomonas frederiksbergensis TaxID=104087 RepID=A0A1H5BCS9_9PSED|nr:ribose transport system substrate-binding protein [Pseudomonas frederiksbergensis]